MRKRFVLAPGAPSQANEKVEAELLGEDAVAQESCGPTCSADAFQPSVNIARW
jgi:hypothetical protein